MSESFASFTDIPHVVLAHVLAFLPMESIAAFTATNRRLRFNVAPLVTKLTVSSVAPMSPAFAKRFENVGSIAFESDDGITILKQAGFAGRLVSFLAAFENLRHVDFTDVVKVALMLLLQVPEETGQEFGFYNWNKYANPLSAAVHLLCEAYRSGELSSNVKVEGLFCPWPGHHQDIPCPTCLHVFWEFPFHHLLGRDEEGAATLTFLDLNGMMSRRRDVPNRVRVSLLDRVERIAQSSGGRIPEDSPVREAGLILAEAIR